MRSPRPLRVCTLTLFAMLLPLGCTNELSVDTADLDSPPDSGFTADTAVETDARITPDAPAATAPTDGGPLADTDAGARTDVPRDTGTDVPRDTGTDVPRDTGVDVPRDAGVDVPRDTGVDVPRDTGVDVPRDTGVDVPHDTGIDVPRDTGIDVPRDTGVDVPRDTGVDVPRDTGIDVPRDTGVDAGMPPTGLDPVVYQGTFPTRTGRFSATLTVLGERRNMVVIVPTNAGASPPLLVLFHGTNGDGNVVVDETNAQTLANTEGVVVIAPTSRWLPFGDFDHSDGSTYWETATNPNPNTNQDLVLTRAILAEAQRAYRVDRTRMYTLGHSNGAFMAHFTAQLFRDRIAAYASNSGGIVNCPRTTSCRFEASGTSCAQLRSRAGYCTCNGPDLPTPVATSGNRPAALLMHGSRDPMVSAYYTCVLEDRLRAAGATFTTTILNDEGHAVPRNFAQTAWAFLRGRTLGMP